MLEFLFEVDDEKNRADFIIAVMGDGIQSELRTLENLFSRVRLNLERAWDHGSSRCPITAILKNPQEFESSSLSTLKKHQKKSFAQLMHLFYKKLTKERWNMVL